MSLERIEALLSRTPAIRSPEHPQRPAPARGALEAHNLSLRYPGSERLSLDQVSFR
ncbi:MAG: hypothetical protein RLZZ11_1429, partial [Cyanobacteriota bacterium]